MRYIYTHTNQQTHAHTHTYTLQNIYYIARIKLRYPWFNVTHQLSVLLKSSLRGLVEGENSKQGLNCVLKRNRSRVTRLTVRFLRFHFQYHLRLLPESALRAV